MKKKFENQAENVSLMIRSIKYVYIGLLTNSLSIIKPILIEVVWSQTHLWGKKFKVNMLKQLCRRKSIPIIIPRKNCHIILKQ